jgi:hypothetical protein
MQRILVAAGAVVCAGAASAAVAWAAAPRLSGATSSTTVRTPSLVRSAHVVRGYAVGPSASYSGDTGSIGVVDPIAFRLPGSAAGYTATVTVSFHYRTSGQGRFYVDASVRSGGRTIDVVSPNRRVLAATITSTSTTVVFRASLRSGVTYRLAVGANLTRDGLQAASITTRRVLVDVEAWPVG